MSLASSAILLVALLACVQAYTSAFYADNGLQQTWPIGRMSRKTRQNLRHEIMTLLGLHHRPKPLSHKKEFSGPQFLLDVYNSMEQEEGALHSPKNLVDHFNTTKGTIASIEHADMIMSFVNKVDALGYSAASHDRDKKFYFDLSQVPTDERLVGAELRIFKTPHQSTVGPHSIYIYKIEQGYDIEDRHLRLLESTRVATNFHGWLEINVTETAQLWAVFPADNLGLLLAVYDVYGREVRPEDAGLIGARGARAQQPFMLAFFTVPSDVRVRRTRAAKEWRPEAVAPTDIYYADRPQWTWGRMAYNKNDHQVCQMRLLYVSFKDLNWQDWIIAPEGYWAYFCYGECSFPLNSHMNATNHAIIQTLVHSMKPLLVPKPCCAPTKLSAISVLYFDNNSDVILKKYRNMVVKSCGCL